MMQRRRALMMMQSTPGPEPGGTPITGLSWTVGTAISSTGVVGAAKYAATSSFIQVPAGVTKIRFTGTASYDGATLNIFGHEYRGSTWEDRLGNMNSGVEFTLSPNTTSIRFTFAFSASSGKAMTQEIVAQCFAAEWVKG